MHENSVNTENKKGCAKQPFIDVRNFHNGAQVHIVLLVTKGIGDDIKRALQMLRELGRGWYIEERNKFHASGVGSFELAPIVRRTAAPV